MEIVTQRMVEDARPRNPEANNSRYCMLMINRFWHMQGLDPQARVVNLMRSDTIQSNMINGYPTKKL